MFGQFESQVRFKSGPSVDCVLIETEDGFECVDESPGSPGDGSDDGGGGGDSGCSSTPFRPSLPQADYDPGFYDEPDFDGTYVGSGPILARIWPDGRREEAYTVSCQGNGIWVVWVDVTLTPRELAERAFARVVLTPPVTDMSPAADVGGVVNLGVWLAIEPQPDLRDSETEGSVSIVLIGEYQGMEWTFGNGDSSVVRRLRHSRMPDGSNDPGRGSLWLHLRVRRER